MAVMFPLVLIYLFEICCVHVNNFIKKVILVIENQNSVIIKKAEFLRQSSNTYVHDRVSIIFHFLDNNVLMTY
jgi:hypothetical protein